MLSKYETAGLSRKQEQSKKRLALAQVEKAVGICCCEGLVPGEGPLIPRFHTMQACFYCSNDIDSDSEGFLPSSCGKCDACLDVRDLLCCTAAVSGNGLSIIIVASDNFSCPDKPVSVSLNEASSFESKSVAQHSFVDRSTPVVSPQPGSFQYM